MTSPSDETSIQTPGWGDEIDVDAVKAKHVPLLRPDGRLSRFCGDCGAMYPCERAKLAGTAFTMRRERDEARAKVTELEGEADTLYEMARSSQREFREARAKLATLEAENERLKDERRDSIARNVLARIDEAVEAEERIATLEKALRDDAEWCANENPNGPHAHRRVRERIAAREQATREVCRNCRELRAACLCGDPWFVVEIINPHVPAALSSPSSVAAEETHAPTTCRGDGAPCSCQPAAEETGKETK